MTMKPIIGSIAITLTAFTVLCLSQIGLRWQWLAVVAFYVTLCLILAIAVMEG